MYHPKPLINQKINLLRLAPFLLLSSLAVQCLYSAWTTGQTADETFYNGSGYAMVRYNNYEILGEHPPLIMQLGSLPLLFLKPHFPIQDLVYLSGSSGGIDISKTGVRFLYEMGNNPQAILFCERAMVVLLALILGVFLFKWAFDLYGFVGAAISLILFSFSPDILAHGSLFTTDMGVTVFFFLTLYSLRQCFAQPSTYRAVLTGLFLGLALLSKISAFILLPVLFVVFIWTYFFEKQSAVTPISIFSPGLILLTLTVLILSLGGTRTAITIMPGCLILLQLLSADLPLVNKPAQYFLNGLVGIGWITCFAMAALSVNHNLIFRALIFFVPSAACLFSVYLARAKNQTWLNFNIKEFLIICVVAAFMVALGHTDFYKTIPFDAFKHYSKTFATAFSHSTHSHTACIDHSYITCDWRYFVTALSVKLPITTILLFFVGLVGMIYLPIIKREKILILLPLVLYLGIASFINKINIGVRHILPIYPFIFLAAGAVGPMIARIQPNLFRKSVYTGLSLLLSLLILRHFSFAPDYLSYFNETVSDAQKATALMTDSNLNWGQDNRRLVDFLKKNEVSFVKIASNTSNASEYDYYGLNWQPMVGSDFIDPPPGFYALSLHAYMEEQRKIKSGFKGVKPWAVVGQTFYVFKIHN